MLETQEILTIVKKAHDRTLRDEPKIDYDLAEHIWERTGVQFIRQGNFTISIVTDMVSGLSVAGVSKLYPKGVKSTLNGFMYFHEVGDEDDPKIGEMIALSRAYKAFFASRQGQILIAPVLA